jgi:hypothetical protein
LTPNAFNIPVSCHQALLPCFSQIWSKAAAAIVPITKAITMFLKSGLKQLQRLSLSRNVINMFFYNLGLKRLRQLSQSRNAINIFSILDIELIDINRGGGTVYIS